MKKTICALLAVVLLALSGCGAQTVLNNDCYAILEKDGAYVMQFHDPVAVNRDESYSGARPSYAIAFDSVAEMKETIETGTFTEEQVAGMQKSFTKADGNVSICNINALYDVKLPAGATVTEILWYGIVYSFSFTDGGISGIIDCTNRDGYESQALLYANRSDENESISIVSRSTEPERNAEVLVFNLTDSNETWKEIRYSYSVDGTEMEILERYQCEVSDTVPQSIIIWGQSNGAYFKGNIWCSDERPGYEWVTSFGLKPYVETVTE